MRRMAATTTILFYCAALVVWAALPRTPAPEGVELYIVSPQDGEKVGREVVVVFGLRGMGVAPAGVEKEETGHHHLLIDVESTPALDQPLPSDANHRHFGGGQTEAVIELEPGEHTLQLLLGDHNHVPHDPPVMSDKITVVVE